MYGVQRTGPNDIDAKPLRGVVWDRRKLPILVGPPPERQRKPISGTLGLLSPAAREANLAYPEQSGAPIRSEREADGK